MNKQLRLYLIVFCLLAISIAMMGNKTTCFNFWQDKDDDKKPPPPPAPVYVPAAPSYLAANAVSAGRIDLTWVDNNATGSSGEEAGFEIERKTGTGGVFTKISAVAANVTSYSDTTGLSASTTYYYRVRASNSAGNSEYSNEVSVITPGPPATTSPLAPSNLIATAVSDTRIDLAWSDNSDNEEVFKVERKTGAGGTYSEITTVGAGITYYSNNSGLSASTTYYYRVRASNSAGNSEYSNEFPVTTSAAPTTPPIAPSGLIATAVASTQIDLNWTDVANEDGYKIERKTGAGGTYVQIATPGANITSYSDTVGLSANTTYYYRIRASNSAGDSSYSAEAYATTPSEPILTYKGKIALEAGAGKVTSINYQNRGIVQPVATGKTTSANYKNQTR